MQGDSERDRREKEEIARQAMAHERLRLERDTDRLLEMQGLTREAKERLEHERLAAKREREELDRQLRRRL